MSPAADGGRGPGPQGGTRPRLRILRGRIFLLLPLLTFPLALSCRGRTADTEPLRMWAFGREGEVVSDLLRGFRRLHPEIGVEVQQIPYTAAHEKLLTAFVGNSMPDVAPIGNTWIPEFEAVGALEPLDARAAASPSVSGSDDFPGIWRTNVVDGRLWGIPWYVDTRVVYYRRDLLAAAGFRRPPETWAEWRDAMAKIRAASGGKTWGILMPTDEWAQPMILGLERGARFLKDGGRRGDFSSPEFAEAARFYVGLFHDSLAPVVSWSQAGNVYQDFERGDFAMWITGPWNIGEFRRRLAPGSQKLWATMPMPSPAAGTGPGMSLAGGSSFVIFRSSARKDDAWKLIEYLSAPEQQRRFYALIGDLPARKTAWLDPALAGDEAIAAFRTQLEHVTPLPQVPEWEQISARLADHFEPAIRGRQSVAGALAALDADVDRMLEKRRWMLDRQKSAAGHAAARAFGAAADPSALRIPSGMALR